MNRPSNNTVSINILDKEYLVACPPETRAQLEEAARYLDKKMREIRASGKVVGTERIAVMAALNITYDLLQGSSRNQQVEAQIRKLQERLDAVLAPPKAEANG